MKFKIAGLLFLLSTCLFSVADAQPPSEEMMKNWQEFMTPGENHKLLATRAGKWNLSVKIWMDPSQPPTENQATSEAKLIMDGRYLMETVKGDFQGMPFEGLATTGFDNGTKKFVSTWIDNLGTGLMTAEGSYDAAKKQFNYRVNYTDPMTGKAGQGRSSERMVDANTWIMESYKPGPDGKEIKDMEITYRREK